jgi:hypothetical protein
MHISIVGGYYMTVLTNTLTQVRLTIARGLVDHVSIGCFLTYSRETCNQYNYQILNIIYSIVLVVYNVPRKQRSNQANHPAKLLVNS